jgi:hypothetical protein
MRQVEALSGLSAPYVTEDYLGLVCSKLNLMYKVLWYRNVGVVASQNRLYLLSAV